MNPERGTQWGPPPLPELLTKQLVAHGLFDDGTAACASHIASARPVAKASLFVDLGSFKFLEADIDGAVAAWRHAIASTNDAAASRALVNLGLLYEHLRLHDQAITVLGSVANRGVEPHLSRSAMIIARCQSELGDTAAATETLARLAQTTMATGGDEQSLAEVLFGLGCVARSSGRDDRAERSWRAASVGADDITRQAAIAQLADLYLDLGRDDDLIDLIQRYADDVGVFDSTAVIARADYLHRVGNDEQASQLAESVAGSELSPDDRFRLAEIRLQCGLVNQAIDELEFLLGSDNAQVECRAAFALGEVYCTYEMGGAAVSMFTRVIDIGDSNWSPRAALALGDELYAQGNADAAQTYWSQAATSQTRSIRRGAEQRLDEAAQVAAAAPEVAAMDHDSPRTSFADHVAPISHDHVRIDAAQPTPASPAQASAFELAHHVPVSAAGAVDQLETHQPSVDQSSADQSSVDQPSVDQPGVDDEQVVEPDLAAPPVTNEPVVVVLSSLESAANGEVEEHRPVGPEALSDLPTSSPHETVEPQTEAHEIEQSGPAETSSAVSVVPESAEPQGSLTDSALETAPDAENPYAGTAPDAENPYAGTAPDAENLYAGTAPDAENPYAVLAPDAHASDVAPSPHNPYAELAPNYRTDGPEVVLDIEPGDWEAMLEDWPDRPGPPKMKDVPRPVVEAKKATETKSGSSAFSRYT